MRTATFTLPDIPLTPNRTGRMHWSRLRGERGLTGEWRMRARMAMAAARTYGTWDGQPFRCSQVTVRFFYRDRRRRDPDNAAASLKALIDGMRPIPGEPVTGYVFPDDDWSHVRRLSMEYGGVDPKRPRIEILVEELVTCADSGSHMTNAQVERGTSRGV